MDHYANTARVRSASPKEKEKQGIIEGIGSIIGVCGVSGAIFPGLA